MYVCEADWPLNLSFSPPVKWKQSNLCLLCAKEELEKQIRILITMGQCPLSRVPAPWVGRTELDNQCPCLRNSKADSVAVTHNARAGEVETCRALGFIGQFISPTHVVWSQWHTLPQTTRWAAVPTEMCAHSRLHACTHVYTHTCLDIS